MLRIKRKKELKGIVGENCCRVIHNKVIKNEKPAKINSTIYVFYPY